MLWFTLRKLAAFFATVLVTAWLIHALLAATGTPPLTGGFASWLGHILIGDFGTSVSAGAPVGGLIAARLAVTVPLALLAMLIAALIGGIVGALAALRPDAVGDRVATALAAIGVAAPNFWIGMMLVLALAGGLHLLPPGGFVPWQQNAGGALLSLLLPAIALAVPVGCALALTVRNALVAARRSAYVLAGRAGGMSEIDAFRRDGLPAAGLAMLNPTVPQALAIVLGTVIVENVFYLPGLGRLILDAVSARDLSLLGGALLVLILLTAGTTFLMEIGFAWVDPRRRPGAAT